MGASDGDSSTQAWWAAGSVMLTQGSSACACAGGSQRGASAMSAAADTPIIALFISSSFPKPRRLSVAVGGPVNYSDADEGDLVPPLGHLAALIQQRSPHGYRRQRPPPLPSRTAQSRHQSQLGVDGSRCRAARSVFTS